MNVNKADYTVNNALSNITMSQFKHIIICMYKGFISIGNLTNKYISLVYKYIDFLNVNINTSLNYVNFRGMNTALNYKYTNKYTSKFSV